MDRGGNDFLGEAESLLGWWRDAGVDCAVQEEPRDWLKPAPAPAPTDAAESGAGAPRGRSGRAEPVREPLPDQLPLFHDWLKASDALPYAAPHAPRVCPSGDPASGLMIMAAMPSVEDCAAGTMLSGDVGRLFDRMLAAIGRSRDTSYIAGLSCLRPAGGRLDQAGATRCGEIARHHLGLVAPKAVLLLGDACSKALLGIGAAQARGTVHRIATPAGEVAAIVTLPPDYLLGQPAAKALAWADLQLLQETLA
ncbi:uracil-DNA glycosylase family protein [Sphingosinicella sp. YJ22]|uniref:uracil-DNA glycosylase family protein n=1 Tax=Sphingosinicella sp. YJ22 TaxID=1104780 RepID=UPI00140D33D2|nr:uracil-DNA glycosylase family protein [Sphingosinicella sp. YJ22]